MDWSSALTSGRLRALVTSCSLVFCMARVRFTGTGIYKEDHVFPLEGLERLDDGGEVERLVRVRWEVGSHEARPDDNSRRARASALG
jgi:hypothetical protein